MDFFIKIRRRKKKKEKEKRNLDYVTGGKEIKGRVEISWICSKLNYSPRNWNPKKFGKLPKNSCI